MTTPNTIGNLGRSGGEDQSDAGASELKLPVQASPLGFQLTQPNITGGDYSVVGDPWVHTSFRKATTYQGHTPLGMEGSTLGIHAKQPVDPAELPALPAIFGVIDKLFRLGLERHRG